MLIYILTPAGSLLRLAAMKVMLSCVWFEKFASSKKYSKNNFNFVVQTHKREDLVNMKHERAGNPNRNAIFHILTNTLHRNPVVVTKLPK